MLVGAAPQAAAFDGATGHVAAETRMSSSRLWCPHDWTVPGRGPELNPGSVVTSTKGPAGLRCLARLGMNGDELRGHLEALSTFIVVRRECVDGVDLRNASLIRR